MHKEVLELLPFEWRVWDFENEKKANEKSNHLKNVPFVTICTVKWERKRTMKYITFWNLRNFHFFIKFVHQEMRKKTEGYKMMSKPFLSLCLWFWFLCCNRETCSPLPPTLTLAILKNKHFLIVFFEIFCTTIKSDLWLRKKTSPDLMPEPQDIKGEDGDELTIRDNEIRMNHNIEKEAIFDIIMSPEYQKDKYR
jgi:hypothetical protein